MSGTAGPGPLGGPRDGPVAREAAVGGALLSGLGLVSAPEVVVDGVGPCRLEIPLAAV